MEWKSVKPLIRRLHGKLVMVDLSAGAEFGAFSPICSWIYRRSYNSEKIAIKTKGDKTIIINDFSDIEYLPYDIDNSLSIHLKGWSKKPMRFRYDNRIGYKSIKKAADSDYKHPVYVSSRHRIYYTTDAHAAKHSEHFTPKIIVGFVTDNSPFYDKRGEFIVNSSSFFITDTEDNLEARYKQLQSNFTKFWFGTGRQECDGEPYLHAYHAAFKLYPDIPLHITTDADINAYFGFTKEEVLIIEGYANKVEESVKKREEKYKKSPPNDSFLLNRSVETKERFLL